MEDDLERKIRAAVSDFSLPMTRGILVGFSGGADSSALVYYLNKLYHDKLYAIHVNHGIRGDEADRDEKFCKNICNSLGIPFFAVNHDVPKIARENGQSIEEAARNVRYRTFSQILAENPDIGCVATAHNADDNLETVLFNMLRGSGINGICGIPPFRDGYIIRPLIYCTKAEIINYCFEKNIKFVTDSTNADSDYTRNYIRNEIVPLLDKINPKSASAVGRLGAILREDSAFIDKCAMDFINHYSITSVVDRKSLRDLDNAVLSRVLIKMYEHVSNASMSYDHVKFIINLIKNGKSESYLTLPAKITFRLTQISAQFMNENEYNKMILSGSHYQYPLHIGENRFDEQGFVIIIGEANKEHDEDFLKAQNIYKLSINAKVNFDKINGSLFVRNRRNGDKFAVKGMTKQVKKIFAEAHIPVLERDGYPLICDDDGIIWIPFYGISEKVSDDSEKNIQLLYAKIK